MGAEQGQGQNASNTNQNKESNDKNKKKKKGEDDEESDDEEEEEESEEESDEGSKKDDKKENNKSSKKDSEKEKEKEIKQKLETISKTSEEISGSKESGKSDSNTDKNKKDNLKHISEKKEEEDDDEEEEEEEDDEEEEEEKKKDEKKKEEKNKGKNSEEKQLEKVKENNKESKDSSELSEETIISQKKEEEKYKNKKEEKEKNREENNKKYKDVLPGEIPEERKRSKATKLSFGYTCCQTIETAHQKEITTMTYILKRNEIATGSVDETIKVWKINYKKGEITLNKELTGHTDSITCLRDFPKLNCFCSASSDNTLKLWDCSSLKCVKTLKYHTKCVLSCCYNPLGNKEIFSGGEDLNIIVWTTSKDVENYEEKKALKGHTKRISSLAFADDYNYLLSGSDDKTLRIWHLKDIEDIQCIKVIKDMMSAIDFLLYLDNRLLVGCEDGVISFIKMNKMKRCRSVKFSKSPIYCFHIFHKHRYLVIGTKDGKVRVWKIGTNKREILNGHSDAITGVCDFEDDYIITTSIDQSIKLWKKD